MFNILNIKIGIKPIALVFLSIVFENGVSSPIEEKLNLEPNDSVIALSERILLGVKTSQNTENLEQTLAAISFETLIEALPNDQAKKVFWINIYNAYYQILATKYKLRRPKVFTKRSVLIGDTKFSLDDIEHGILRRFRSKFSLGYLPQIFVSKKIKSLCVQQIDYRIHFALNCGAKSCTPIAFYSYKTIEAQLNQAAVSFLESETTIDDINKKVTTSKILQWFKGDFGGEQNIKLIIQQHLNKNVNGYKLRFKKYDWNEDLRNFK